MLRSNTSSLASSSSDWEFALVKIVLEPTCKCITFNTNLIWWLCFFLIVTSPLWWEITSPANNWSWTWSPPSSLFDDFIFFQSRSCNFGSTILKVRNIIIVDCCDRKREQYLKLICMRISWGTSVLLTRAQHRCWYNCGCWSHDCS